MVDLKIGTVIPKSELRSGTTQNGIKYFVGTLKAEKGYDKIDVWAENPDELNAQEDVEVVSIIAVKKSAKKYTDKEGAEKWMDTYSVNAKLKNRGVAPQMPTGFEKLTDEEIPF